jgi:hypothetical protein
MTYGANQRFAAGRRKHSFTAVTPGIAAEVRNETADTVSAPEEFVPQARVCSDCVSEIRSRHTAALNHNVQRQSRGLGPIPVAEPNFGSAELSPSYPGDLCTRHQAIKDAEAFRTWFGQTRHAFA